MTLCETGINNMVFVWGGLVQHGTSDKHPLSIREMSGNFTLPGKWSACVDGWMDGWTCGATVVAAAGML